MSNRFRWLFIGAIGVCVGCASPSQTVFQNPSTQSTEEAAISDGIIIKYKAPSLNATSLTQLSLDQAFERTVLSHIGAEEWSVPYDKIQDVLSVLKMDPNIQYAEPNYMWKSYSVGSSTNVQWHLNNTHTGADIRAEKAWSRPISDEPIIIAIIDTGVDFTHPDLRDSIWINSAEDINNDGLFTAADINNIDDDGNGYIDDGIGWDFVENDNNPFTEGYDQHGTHIAGIIGASHHYNPSVKGVLPNVSLMVLKFIGPDGGKTANAIRALEYAQKMGAVISNNSWGGTYKSLALEEAIDAISDTHLFVTAAGNEGIDLDKHVRYPAGYDLKNILTVAATNETDTKPIWSNYGLKSVHVAAPGERIYSTLPGNHYGYVSGTSMAAPIVAGIAGMIISEYNGITPTEIKKNIQLYSDPIAALNGITASNGRVNMIRVLDQSEQNISEQTEGYYARFKNKRVSANMLTNIPYAFYPDNEGVALDIETFSSLGVGFNSDSTVNHATMTLKLKGRTYGRQMKQAVLKTVVNNKVSDKTININENDWVLKQIDIGEQLKFGKNEILIKYMNGTVPAIIESINIKLNQ